MFFHDEVNSNRLKDGWQFVVLVQILTYLYDFEEKVIWELSTNHFFGTIRTAYQGENNEQVVSNQVDNFKPWACLEAGLFSAI
jgi:hypothetical protein